MNKVISNGEKCVENKSESHFEFGMQITTHSNPNEEPISSIIF